MPKIPSGTTARSVSEWIGRTPDTWPPPETVQLRILARQGGKCAITGHKFAPGDRKQLDHIIELADGGQNRESNLQWVLDAAAHKPKSAQAAAERAKVRAKAKAHAGISTASARSLKSRGFGQAERPRKEGRPVVDGASSWARRFPGVLS